MLTPSEGTSSLIGVAICITGNTCISAALNIQKLAHTRLSVEANTEEEQQSRTLSRRRSRSSSIGRSPGSERTPLLSPSSQKRPALSSSVSDPLFSQQEGPSPHTLVPVSDVVTGNGTMKRRKRSGLGKERKEKPPRVDKEFLRSKLWWCGLALLNLGELGNFMAYGLAQASLIAPLGTVALVANCILAPLILKEPFRKQDVLGCAFAVLGGITVVYASNSSDHKMFPDEILKAIKTLPFTIYSIVCIVAAMTLAGLSRTKWGDAYLMIDMGICAIAGGFTVLSTKAISSFLNLLFVGMFRYWITYPILLVLVGTALIQVNFINKALQRFDSRVVIPAQFVSFSASAIVGSAVLFREFDNVDTSSFINFLFGCGMSSLGVYLLTRSDSAPTLSEAQNDLPTSAPRVQVTTADRRTSLSGAGAGGTNSLLMTDPQGSIRARTLSVTLGGGQYLMLAHSPGGHTIRGRGGVDSEDDEEGRVDRDRITSESETEVEDEEELQDGVLA